MKGIELAGQVALVTGASSGVGWQTAVRLAGDGMRLCLSARRHDALQELQTELAAGGAEVMVVSADVTRAEEIERVVAECIARFGRIDLLVNVPSVQLFAPFEDYAWDEITRIMDVNFYGYLRTTRAVLPVFRRQGGGHIVNVLSIFAQMGFPLFSIYAASKHALLGWADSLRLELHGTGIEISNVLLPTIATPFYDVAPTRLHRQPRPPPPVQAPELAARAVARCARHPDPHHVPVLLQGKLALVARRAAPALVDAVLARWGQRMVTGARPVHRPEGNLFSPAEPPFGPRGTAQVTPTWLRFGLNAITLAGIAATLLLPPLLARARWSQRALESGGVVTHARAESRGGSR